MKAIKYLVLATALALASVSSSYGAECENPGAVVQTNIDALKRDKIPVKQFEGDEFKLVLSAVEALYGPAPEEYTEAKGALVASGIAGQPLTTVGFYDEDNCLFGIVRVPVEQFQEEMDKTLGRKN